MWQYSYNPPRHVPWSVGVGVIPWQMLLAHPLQVETSPNIRGDELCHSSDATVQKTSNIWPMGRTMSFHYSLVSSSLVGYTYQVLGWSGFWRQFYWPNPLISLLFEEMFWCMLLPPAWIRWWNSVLALYLFTKRADTGTPCDLYSKSL